MRAPVLGRAVPALTFAPPRPAIVLRSVEVESHPCNHIDIFEFAAALLLNSVLTILRYAEVVAFVEDGDPGARYVVLTSRGW